MKLATTTGDFERFGCSVSESIGHVADAGFRCVDLNLYREATPDSLTLSQNWRKTVDEWQRIADDRGVKFVQCHSAGGNPLLKDEKYELLLQATIRSIEICGILGIPNTVVHSGWGENLSKEEYFKQNLEFYRLLLPAMEKNNVSVLIENSTKKNMGDNYYFLTGEEMAEFLHMADHPLFGACWDTGHANCEGHQYEDIMALGDGLRAIHFNDNSGRGDEHVLPYCGTMSVDAVMNGLLDSGYKGYFTFEADSTLRPYKYWQGDRRNFGKERVTEAPLNVQKTLERAMYEIGEYILRAYDCFEY